MNARKRQAQDPLSPIGSAKHRRTRYNLEEDSSLAARWIRFFKEGWALTGLTFAQLTEARTYSSEPPLLPIYSSPHRPRSHLSPRTPSNYHPPRSPPTRPSSPSRLPKQSSRDRRKPNLVPEPSRPSTISATTSTASIPSTSTSTYTYTSHPEVDRALTEAARRIRRKSPEKPYSRPHIYADSHKAKVKLQTQKDREEMEEELYNIKRSAGYKSDFHTFRGLLEYQRKLEALAISNAPSSSSTDLRLRHTAPEQHRRYSEGDSFLERALAKAKATLDGPKPCQPFLPTFDQLQISTRAKDEKIEQRLRPKRKPLPASLSPEDDAKVDTLLKTRGVIAKHAREQVSDRDLSRLRPSQWLNDEIINFYGSMMTSRSEDSKENPAAKNGAVQGKPPNAYYFSTFFWSKLYNDGYEKGRLAKWTKKVDIFSKDVILIPVNHNNAHWTAAAINFRKKRIESYDSMGMDRQNVYKRLRGYLDAEHRNKKKQPFDFAGWEDHVLEDTPQQENGFDCGVFTCQFLEHLSRGEETFIFTQADMPYLRRRMIWEIGNTKFMDSS